MLTLLGSIAGNILSLPGILGLALGMMTRNYRLGAAMGGVVGILETLIFVNFRFGQIEILELAVAICVGLAAGALGSAIRIRGATV